MGDTRFLRSYEALRDAADKAASMRALSDEEIIQALGAASMPGHTDPYLANVLASEALNRLRRAATMRVHVAEPILQVDERGVVLDANPAALRLIQHPLDWLVGRNAMRALGLRVADSGTDVDPFQASVIASGHDRGAGWVRTGSGRMVAMAYRSALVRVDGATVGAIIALRDVTNETRDRAALDRAEARQRVLLDAIADQALVLLDPQGIVETWNEGARRIHGLSADDAIGRHFRSLYTPADQARELPEHELALAARHGRFHVEETRARYPRSRFRARVDLAAIRDAMGLRGFALVEQEVPGDIAQADRLEG